MRCRSFYRDLPDWIAGRLADFQAEEMRAHASACSDCAAEESSERALRATLKTMPAPPERDILTRLALRIEAPAPRRSWVPLPTRWAFAGTLGVSILCAVLYVREVSRPAIEHRTTVATYDQFGGPRVRVDEGHVVQIVAAMRETTDPDSEYTIDTANHVPSQQRAVLVGARGK